MSSNSLSWAMPVMRTGYAGRGLVYVVVAGFSLYAIWQGGDAQGTSEALSQLETSTGGGILLILIFLGMLCYMVWRLLDSAFDLENYGSDGEGTIARIGMIVTGLIHGALGVLALTVLLGSGGQSGGGGGSTIGRTTGWLLSQPFGPYLVGAVALVTIGAGLYYLKKAFAEDYRKFLRANHFTMNWNWALKAGVAAQGVAVTVIGGLFMAAALQADPSKAGGVGQAFEWISGQTHGRLLVSALCLGLAAFAFFCFVNAAYRIVPKVADEDVETLAVKMKEKAKQKAAG